MTAKWAALLLSILMPGIASATAYLSADFSNNIPSDFTLMKADGGELQPKIYNNIGNNMAVAWIAGQLPGRHGRVALSPTRYSDKTLAAENWMILPSVRIDDTDAVIRWEARSLHRHFAETYRIAVRETGHENWIDIYECEGETSTFSTHAAPLSAYLGKEIDLAFIATTQRGFMLAIDNIFIGVPEDDFYVYESTAPHYVDGSGSATVTGTLTYFGHQCRWPALQLSGFGSPQIAELPPLRCGDSVEVEFTVDTAIGETYDYLISAIDGDDQILMYADFMSCSHFSRTQVIDRCSGTWCNNCPVTELTTSRLEGLYGDQVIILESHVNDKLTETRYWNDYLSDFIFAIPALVPNHDKSRFAYTIKENNNFSEYLAKETKAKVFTAAQYAENGDIVATSEISFAEQIDNTDDRYRMAYILMADIHGDLNPAYVQQSQPISYRDDQFYFQPDIILPEMMFFENVPIDASVGYHGVPNSLPERIDAGSSHQHTFALPYSPDTEHSNVRILAMIVDTSTGTIMNASVAAPTELNAIPTVGAEASSGPAEYYDLIGRRIDKPQKGLYIVKKGNATTKEIIN